LIKKYKNFGTRSFISVEEILLLFFYFSMLFSHLNNKFIINFLARERNESTCHQKIKYNFGFLIGFNTTLVKELKIL